MIQPITSVLRMQDKGKVLKNRFHLTYWVLWNYLFLGYQNFGMAWKGKSDYTSRPEWIVNTIFFREKVTDFFYHTYSTAHNCTRQHMFCFSYISEGSTYIIIPLFDELTISFYPSNFMVVAFFRWLI